MVPLLEQKEDQKWPKIMGYKSVEGSQQSNMVQLLRTHFAILGTVDSRVLWRYLEPKEGQKWLKIMGYESVQGSHRSKMVQLLRKHFAILGAVDSRVSWR